MAHTAGTVTGILGFMRAHLDVDGGVSLTNDPTDPGHFRRWHLYHPVEPRSRSTRRRDHDEFDVNQRGSLTTWRVNVGDATRSASQFLGDFLDPLVMFDPPGDTVPPLNRAGQCRLAVLDAIAAEQPFAQIVELVGTDFAISSRRRQGPPVRERHGRPLLRAGLIVSASDPSSGRSNGGCSTATSAASPRERRRVRPRRAPASRHPDPTPAPTRMTGSKPPSDRSSQISCERARHVVPCMRRRRATPLTARPPRGDQAEGEATETRRTERDRPGCAGPRVDCSRAAPATEARRERPESPSPTTFDAQRSRPRGLVTQSQPYLVACDSRGCRFPISQLLLVWATS